MRAPAVGSPWRAVVAVLAACHDSKQPPVAAGPDRGRQRRPGPVSARGTLLSTNGIQRGDLRADTAYRARRPDALRPAQGARHLHHRNRRAAGNDGSEPRRVQHAHADPRGVGRRRRQAGRRQNAQVAARDVQPGRAPDLERHDATRSRAAAIHRPGSASRSNQTFLPVQVPAELRRKLLGAASRTNERRSLRASRSSSWRLRAARGVAAARKPTPCTLVPSPRTESIRRLDAGVGKVVLPRRRRAVQVPGRGITLRGDSAERYPDHDQMIGHAVYDEPRLHVTSNFLNYFPADGDRRPSATCTRRCRAVRRSLGRSPSGGGVPKGIRPRQQLLATSRPTINIVEKDSAGKTARRCRSMANQVFMDGDSLIYGGGQVVITRPEIGATADSAFIDQSARPCA